MLSYYFLFAIELILALIARNRASKSNLFLGLMLGGIFVFFAFREGFTPDFYTYESEFQLKMTSDRHLVEPIYMWMVKTIPFRLELMIQTGLLCFVLFLILRQIDVEYWWFCILLLFLMKSFILGNAGALRSSFVTVAFILAVQIRDGTRKRFLIGASLIIISALIHKSGYVMLIPYLLCSPNIVNGNKYNILIIASIILIVISLFFANTLNTWLNLVLGEVEEFEAYKQDEISDVIKIGTYTLLRLALLFFLFFTTIQHISIDHGNFANKCIKITVLFLLLLLMPGIGLNARFGYYLSIPVLLGSTSILSYEESLFKKYAYMVGWLLLAAWEMYIFMGTENYQIAYAFYKNILF